MAQKLTKTKSKPKPKPKPKPKALVTAKTDASPKPRQRRVQERAEITIEKIRDAATRLFAERGYDGASIRDVENAAGVKRGLVNYHFGNKETLWKAVVEHVFALLSTYMNERAGLMRDLSPKERISYVIRSQIRFYALNPDLNRLMIQEGKRDTSRLRYIVDTYSRPAMNLLRDIAMDALPIDQDEFVYWYYMYLGSSSLIYAMAPESSLLFGVDVMDEKMIDRHADFMTEFLLSRSGGNTAK
jgi:AcrR family transcriptional regulator